MLNAVTALPIGSEPHATALLLAAFAVLVGASVILSRASGRFGLPVMLVFLGFGMLAGSEGVGRIPFEEQGCEPSDMGGGRGGAEKRGREPSGSTNRDSVYGDDIRFRPPIEGGTPRAERFDLVRA